jgi:predicted acetyltransferase
MHLVWPSIEHLPSYVAALERGFSPDNVRGLETTREELAAIALDPARFLAGLVDLEAKGPPITLPDGTVVKRLPGYKRWMWDGEFCGTIGFRWQPRTLELPPYVLGHVGYAVPAWKQGRGYATRALALLLPDAKARGLAWIELTTDLDNIPSQRVILNNGGVLIERFIKPAAYGSTEGLRYRIYVTPQVDGPNKV